MKALIALVKALALAIDNHYHDYDRSTGRLMIALAEWVKDHEK